MKKRNIVILIISFIFIIIVSFVALLCWLLGVFDSPTERYIRDIAELKFNDPGYYFFPVEIPEDAKEVEWTQMPSILQGNGYETLGFYASEEYIQSVIEQYSVGARVMVYCKPNDDYYGEQWYAVWSKEENVSDETSGYGDYPFDARSEEFAGVEYVTDVEYINSSDFDADLYEFYWLQYAFPGRLELMERENYEEAIVYILHDNDNWNHYHVRGFYVIPSDNYIFYFYE